MDLSFNQPFLLCLVELNTFFNSTYEPNWVNFQQDQGLRWFPTHRAGENSKTPPEPGSESTQALGTDGALVWPLVLPKQHQEGRHRYSSTMLGVLHLKERLMDRKPGGDDKHEEN